MYGILSLKGGNQPIQHKETERQKPLMHCENLDQTFPVLKTKLHRPALTPRLVPRTRLFERLSSGLQCRLTVVSAAAGSGKTTLLCSWIDSLAPGQYAWLALDEEDNDPVRFWRYMLTALTTLSPGLDKQLLPLLPTMQSDRYFLTMLVNTLNETLGQVNAPALLFLDDYHVITMPTLHQALDFLIEHLSHLHIVLSTRADPPLRLARLRGRGQLLELRDMDLCFTSEESTIFLRERMPFTLTPEEHAQLYAQTEGWVTGLQLASLTLQNQTHNPGVLHTLKRSSRSIEEYLTDEVLQEQPESIRLFLLHTSILERFSASLCDALCQQENGQEMLTRLEHKNLFLIPLDEECQWFRYHHLFTDVLRLRLRQMAPEQRKALHVRASTWYEQHGNWHEAIHHALAAQDWSRVISLVEPIGRLLVWRYGEVVTVVRWIEQIPQDLVLTSPRLCLVNAWLLLLQGSHTDIERWVDAAESASAEIESFTEIDPYQQRSSISTVPSQISALRVLVSGLRRDIEQTLALCQRAYTQLLPDEHTSLAIVQNAEGLVLHAQGQVELACARFLAASQNMLLRGVNSTANILLACAAQALVVQGKLHEAWQVAQQAIHLGSTPGGPPLPSACYAYATCARILCEWNDLDGALAAITQAIAQGEQTDTIDFLCDGYSILMSISLARGLLPEAQAALALAEEAARKRDIALKYGYIATARASLWLAEGRLDEVKRWQQHRQQQSQPIPLLLAEMHALIDARYALLTQRPQEALAILDPLLPAAEAGKRGDHVLKILLLQTLAYQALESEQAGACLERLIPLADREGYLRLFLDTGMAPDKLFAHLPEHLRTSLTVRAVLRAWRQPDLTPSLLSHAQRSAQPFVEPLSESP